ncbi:MAG: PorV/PorQ family protein [Ferruginibacter sp.]|nr:PorV/PorQ family protein [Bacteroidota bacterium]MBX2919216.1 PorV/PorQ family protein [Ferruginibacter sp.]MCB0708234.1 PorV/PorQ family protein [Chitinophagaceae bacterium]
MRLYAKISFVLFMLAPLFSLAQFRKYSNEFLNIGAGARGLAMGGAQIASAKDETAGYWNPAGLSGINDYPSIGLMHADYFGGIAKYDYLAGAMPIQDNKRALGISILRFAVDDIPNTLFLVEPDGSINYNNIQTFSSADYAFLLSFAQKIKETETQKISFGINAKVIYRKVGKFATAWGFGLDAGLQMHGEKWHAGIVARDITTTFNAWTFHFTEREKEVFYLTKNDIPVKSNELTAPRLVIGGAYDFRLGNSVNLSAEVNADLTFDGQRNTIVSGKTISIDPHVGLEASIKNVFFIRAGITNFQRALADKDTLNQKRVWIYQPSAGAGFKIKNVMIDYAFTNLANQSNPLYTHIFSLRLNLAGKKESE